MGDEVKYDCLTCPYPRYRDENHIYCDICIREIMDRHSAERKTENANSTHPSAENPEDSDA